MATWLRDGRACDVAGGAWHDGDIHAIRDL